MGDLVLEAGDHHLAAREPEDPLIIDEPDRHVPTLTEQTQRAPLELRELGPDQPPREAFVNGDLGGPLTHATTLSRAPARTRPDRAQVTEPPPPGAPET